MLLAKFTKISCTQNISVLQYLIVNFFNSAIPLVVLTRG